MQVCDFSSPQTLDTIKGLGLAGIIRYVSDFGSKNITKGEFEAALGRGLTVTLVCEQGQQPALRGVLGGLHDGIIANQQADAIGYDPAATIYYVAEDPARLPVQDWPTVEQYFRTLSGRPRGAYGGLALVSHLMGLGLASKGWVVETWGGTLPGVHLEQLVGADTHGLSIDLDEVLQPDYGQHPRPTVKPPGGPVLSKPAVAVLSSKSGKGYALVAGDGGVFAFGDFPFHGSLGGQKLNAPIVSATMTPSGNGYWLIGADGGVFTFGDAPFAGAPT